MATFLEMSGISKRFGGVHALRDVDLTLEVGEVHCLVGENGSGKSTLIKIISGVEAPERGGRIVISGKEYPKLNPVRSTHCGIQVIYQDLSLFPNLTVAENIAMAHHLGGLRRVDWTAMRATAVAAMAKVGVELDPETKVSDLSIAGRQLVAICRALAADAKLLIMDEPTASLTRHEVDALIKLVSDLKRSGICIVFVSHRLDEVLEIAERVTVLRDGAKVGTFAADDDRRPQAQPSDDREGFRLSSAGARVLPRARLCSKSRALAAMATITMSAFNCTPEKSSASPDCSVRAEPSSHCRCSA